MPVVLEEKVEVEAEGDVKEGAAGIPEVIEIKDDEDDEDDEDDVDVEFENKMADKRKMQRVYQSLGDEDDDEDDGLEEFMSSSRMKAAKFWVGQVKSYESKIDDLRKELAFVRDGFRAAKRMVDRQKEDLNRIVEVNRTVQDENWTLHERLTKLVEDNRREMAFAARQRSKRQRIQELRKEVDEEKKRRRNVELELEATRKRLWMFTRRSVPRKSNRLIRRVDSYEDGEESSSVSVEGQSSSDEEQKRLVKPINIMNNED